jgi:hypothetical protein
MRDPSTNVKEGTTSETYANIRDNINTKQDTER